MKLTILIAIIVALKYLVPKLVDFGTPEKSERKSEWEYRVIFAKLDKDLFEEADDEEKEELLYYFTHKIRYNDNYSDTSFQNMPKSLQIVWLVNELENEVNNGGFFQFFTNSSGQYAYETLEALDLIGAMYNHELLTNAVELLIKHNENPDALKKRINSKTLYQILDFSELYDNDELQGELNELDKAFYTYRENLSKLKMDYFERNQNTLWDELREKYGG